MGGKRRVTVTYHGPHGAVMEAMDAVSVSTPDGWINVYTEDGYVSYKESEVIRIENKKAGE